jgi:mono/diheme cytochrome c family protein
MKFKLFVMAISTVVFSACGGGESTETSTTSTPSSAAQEETAVVEEVAQDPMENVGIGPIDELVFDDEIDMELAEAGKVVYEEKCTACHKPNKRYIGPAPAGIYERRNPAWVMNMILNPDEMVAKDPIARALLAEYASPMANQNLTIDEARGVVEYFRTLTTEE